MQNLKNYKTQVTAIGVQDSVLLQDLRATLQQSRHSAQVQDVCKQSFPILQVIHSEKIAERPIYFQIPFCALPR